MILCCFCCENENSSNSSLYVTDKDEPYEYVVEKLAIKRVPLSLFATYEDLRRLSKTMTNNSSTESTESKKSEVICKAKPSVTFEMYYKTKANEDNTHETSNDVVNMNDDSSHTVLNYDKNEERKQPVKILPNKILTSEQEEELIAHVLNRHSSLYTVNDKDAIPKDPDHLPNTKVNIPSTVRAAIRKQTKQLIKAEVHNVAIEPHEGQLLKSTNDMEPSLKETIQALKFAQKPHFPGVTPKNQRSLKNDFCNDKNHSVIKVNTTSSPTRYVSHYQEVIASRTIFNNQNVSKLHLEEKYNNNKPKEIPVSSHLTRPTILQTNITTDIQLQPAEHRTIQTETKTSSELLFESFKIKVKKQKECIAKKQTANRSTNSPKICMCNKNVNTSKAKVKDKQLQFAEVVKGPNLKWKIIIKHHQDKVEDVDSNDSDESSSETTTSDSNEVAS